MSNDKSDAAYHGNERPWVSPGPPPWAEPSERLLLGQTKPTRSRLRLVVAVGLLITIALIGIGLAVKYSGVVPAGIPLIGKDSGLAACEAIATKGKAGGPIVRAEGDDSYQRMRSVFAESRYEEIRNPGVQFTDLVRQLDGMGKDSGLAGLAFIGPLTQSYAALSGGCAEHGYTLPPLTD